MKKLIVAILAVLIAFVSAVFAVTGEQLQINATVLPVAPVFSIYGGKSSDAVTVQGGTTPGNITFTSTEKNLAEQDITVYIRLYQSNKAKYSGTANLTITATPLVNQTVQTGTYQTAAPAVANLSKTESPNGITYANNNPSSSTVNGNTVVSYSPTYDGRSIQPTNIGTFNLTWSHNDDLAAGSYQATITLGYTAP